MTPEEHVVIQYYAAIDRGDVDGLLDLFAPDAHYDRPGFQSIDGRDGLRHFYTNQRVLSGGRHELSVILTNGELVSCFGRYTGSKRGGESVDVLFADLHRVRRGVICERRTFFFAPLV